MEQKQNVKPLTIEDQINLLWKSNSRIPFMQSKEILGLGYREGMKYVNNEVCIVEENSSMNLNSFTGTSKEFITNTENKDQKRKEVKTQSKTSEIDIEQAKYNLLKELIDEIEDRRDLMTIYRSIKTKRTESLKKINMLKRKFGTK